jgi:hypothetical protein
MKCNAYLYTTLNQEAFEAFTTGFDQRLQMRLLMQYSGHMSFSNMVRG